MAGACQGKAALERASGRGSLREGSAGAVTQAALEHASGRGMPTEGGTGLDA